MEMASSSSTHRDEEYNEDLAMAIRSKPFIFKLPKSVHGANPDAFLPRLIALGLLNAKNKMQCYKLYMVFQVRRELHLPQIECLCTKLLSFKLRILACYNIHLEIHDHNLVKDMVVDALFLLRLLLHISNQMQNSLSIELPLPNFDARFNSLHINHEWLLNDVVKLENQIPLLVFKGILPQHLKVTFPVLLYYFCQSLSPFALDFDTQRTFISTRVKPYAEIADISAILNQSHHFLHFMYLSILIFPCTSRSQYELQSGFDDSLVFTFFQKWFSKLESVLELIHSAIELIGLLQKLVELMRMVKIQSASSHVIPSASQLLKLPVEFKSTVDGILDSKFNIDTQGHYVIHPDRLIYGENPPILTIPVMNINAYTETLFGNLLAFESMANINPPVFALYIELMTGLIRNPVDVQILKQKGIMKSHLDNDKEVVKMFKRLGSTISNLKNPTIYKNPQPMRCTFEKINKYDEDYKEMVEEINQYYHSFWRVKATIFWNKFVTYAWKMVGIVFILCQILVMVKKMGSSFVGNDEPDYDQIPPT